VNETKLSRALPPIIVCKGGVAQTVRAGVGTPVILDFDELMGEPAFYLVGVDDAEIIGTHETLEAALEDAERALTSADVHKVDLEIADGELNPLPLEGDGVAVFVLFDEDSEEEPEEDVPEEVEWRPIEGAPWEDMG